MKGVLLSRPCSWNIAPGWCPLGPPVGGICGQKLNPTITFRTIPKWNFGPKSFPSITSSTWLIVFDFYVSLQKKTFEIFYECMTQRFEVYSMEAYI